MTYSASSSEYVERERARAAQARQRERERQDAALAPYRDNAALFMYECVIIDDAQPDDDDQDMATVPFHLWPAQETLLADMLRERLLLVLKSRQLGASLLACAYALWLCLFHPGRLVLMFSIGQDEADEMLRRVSVMYHRLPAELRNALDPLKKENTSELTWANGSRVESLPTTRKAGSGYTASLVILDEFAKNQWDTELYTAVKPTIDGGGKMIILSSANGTSNLFYEMCQRAQKGLGRFAFRFLPWTARPGRDDAWYAAVAADAVQASLMGQEYPACVVGSTRASAHDGIFLFEDHPDYLKGEAPIQALTTHLGYSITTTPNHQFYQPDETWRAMETLHVGDVVRLLPPTFGQTLQTVPLDLGMPILSSLCLITEDIAEFLGVFMGDGSLMRDREGSGYTLSVVFDRRDESSIARMKQHMTRMFGRWTERVSGAKKGCIELRVHSKYLGEFADSLGLINRRSDGAIRRNVHVPPYIFSSPKPVVAAFLRGLFDADGFIGYEKPRIIFFSKHEQFIRDVQLLLLGFGITSRLRLQEKKSGEGHLYTGRELALRKQETIRFMQEIGFISDRKRARWPDEVRAIHHNDIPIVFEDRIVEKQDAGVARVYDMEVLPEHYYSGNGIWIHNSPDEAFSATNSERFLPSMHLWDACYEALPPLDVYTPMVLAADAGVSNDTFGLVGVTRHPERHDDIAVRLVRVWVPRGGALDFDEIEAEFVTICETFNVIQITFDAYQLHQMMMRLGRRWWTDAFSQQGERLEADKALLDGIQQRRVAQDGNAELRQHLDNADRKVDAESHKLRIVKRKDGLKVDLAVCLSQARHRALSLNI